MTEYRRHYVPSGTFFFTVNIAERSKSLLMDRIDHLRLAFRTVKAELPFEIDAPSGAGYEG